MSVWFWVIVQDNTWPFKDLLNIRENQSRNSDFFFYQNNVTSMWVTGIK